jgi:hypothetical protein
LEIQAHHGNANANYMICYKQIFLQTTFQDIHLHGMNAFGYVIRTASWFYERPRNREYWSFSRIELLSPMKTAFKITRTTLTHIRPPRGNEMKLHAC